MNFGAVSIPAREIGGDYYDFFSLENGRVGIVVADIVGKGIPAALFMVMFKSIMQSNILRIFSPKEALIQMNQILYEDKVINKFVPAFYGILDPETCEFRYCNAGHEPPILYSQGVFSALDTGGSPLGAWPSDEFEERGITLAEGDMVAIFTDGIIEARNEEGSDFGHERLKTFLGEHANQNATDIVAGLYQVVDRYMNNQEQHDDLTVVVIQGGPPVATKEIETPTIFRLFPINQDPGRVRRGSLTCT